MRSKFSLLSLVMADPQRLAAVQLQLHMEEEEEDDAVMAALLLLRDRRHRQERRPRRYWVRKWISQRKKHGQFSNLFKELEVESRSDYLGYIRMYPELFAEILQKISHRITKGPRCVCRLLFISLILVLKHVTILLVMLIT